MTPDQQDASKLSKDIYELIFGFERFHPHLEVEALYLKRTELQNGMTKFSTFDDVEVKIILK